MKVRISLLVLVLTLLLHNQSQSQTTEEIVATLDIEILMDNGPKDNRINIAIANLTNADGTYTYQTKAELDTDIDPILANFDINNPDHQIGFAQYRDFFNVHSVFFPDPLVFETVPSFYQSANDIRDALFLPFEDGQHGWVTMLYSFIGGGGGGAGVDRASRTGFAQLYGLDIHTVFHEFNHTMPGLHDEYTASGAWSNYVPIESANLTGQSLIDDIPWRNWINPNLPLPTPYDGAFTNDVGLFEGNISGYFGSYRPTARSCIMGAGGFGDNYGQEMCSVCLQRFVSMLYKYVNVIETPLPASQDITVNGNETLTFSADIIKPEPNTQKYEWFVNGILYQEDVESIDVTFEACSDYTVELVVTDTTDFVRYDEKFKDLYPEPKQSHLWTIDQTAVDEYNLAMATTVTSADCSDLPNGSILVEPSGGTGPYEIFVDGIARTSPVTSLVAGVHSLLVSDANGCSVNEQVEITQDPVLDFDFCSSSYAGLWNITVWDITEDNNPVDETTIEYLWSTGSTIPLIQVPAGSYSLSITSSTGCVVNREITVSEVSSSLNIFTIANHTSNNENNGSISLELTGGKEPYEIVWHEKLFTDQTSPIADQVISSGYTNVHEPIDAFDNSSEYTNFWAASFNGSNYIGFDFEETIKIEAYSITSNNDVKGRDAKSWILQGSDDATTWSDIETVQNFEFAERQQRFEFKLTQPVFYQYFRLFITENWGDGWLAIREVEFANFTFQEMPQFENQMDAIDLAPTYYKYYVKDANSSCIEEIIEINDVTLSQQPIEVSQFGNYQVQINNPNPDFTYYWATNADMTGKLHSGTSFQPESSGQYFVQAYETSLSSIASGVKGFAISMPEVPEVVESGGILTIVNPKSDSEYIWYDQSKNGVELHNGNTFTPSADGYYFAVTRKPLPVIDPIDPGTISGITLWADASDLDGNGVTNGVLESSAAHNWLFKEGGRFREGNFFIYRDNYQNGLGVADFSTIWLQSLEGTTNRLRTVILVYKENDLSLTETAPFTGLEKNIPKHSDASQLFANNTPSTTLDGRVYLNGELVDPLTTPNPMKFIVLSSVFTQLIVNSIDQTVMEWDGKVAELIVWDVELTHEEVVGVNEFLRKKWLSTAHLESARIKIGWGAQPLDDQDLDGFKEDVDCDDLNPNVNSDAIEICDGIDNNCNGVIDEGFETTYYADFDNDGFGDANITIFACDAPTGYVNDDTDCDDSNAAINSNRTEIPYNGIDDDCNPATLDDDLDEDGFVLADDCDDNNANVNSDQTEIPYNGIDDDCNPTTLDDDLDQDGFVLADDCDDTNASINPNVTEIPYNGIDDDCNAATSDDDLDQDGFLLADDCDDTNASVNSDQTEIPYNGIDDDCNAATLDDDLDQDGFTLADDCDDTNANINPSATEIPYNGIDDDCNTATLDDDLDEDGFVLADDCDDNNASVNSNQTEVPYNRIDDDCDATTLDDDLDEDGFVLADDCDDNNASVNSDQTEIPYNGLDDDCNPVTLDDDLDQDGFVLANDCDDTNNAIHPDAEDIPNNDIDENCDGSDLIVLSISDNLDDKISIYPNPATNFIKIELEKESAYTIRLYDLSGALLIKIENVTEIPIHSIHSGEYILTITFDNPDNQKIVQSIIIEK